MCDFIGHHFDRSTHRCIGCGEGQMTRTVSEILAAIADTEEVGFGGEILIPRHTLLSALGLTAPAEGKGEE